MKTIKLIIVALISFLVTFLIHPRTVDAASCSHRAGTFMCVKYLRNYDGDTFNVDIPRVHPLLGKDISIRVRGVDTAELHSVNSCEKAAALKSRDFLKLVLSSATRIDLKQISRDKYFRIDAEVIVDGKSLRDLILNNKMGYVYSGTRAPIDWCAWKYE